MQMMNWFKKNETRSEPTVDTSNGTIALESYYNTGTLTEEKIMKIPTVKACLELISGSIAHMPIYLYRENEDGSVERKLADYRERLLNEEANDFLTGHNFKKNMVKDYLIHGSSYVNIYKKSMSIEGLYLCLLVQLWLIVTLRMVTEWYAVMLFLQTRRAMQSIAQDARSLLSNHTT